MSNIEPTPQIDQEYKPEYKVFAFVVDGEVAWIHRVDTRVEHAIAVMSSNPVVVPIPDELVPDINFGWTYNGVSFDPPV